MGQERRSGALLVPLNLQNQLEVLQDPGLEVLQDRLEVLQDGLEVLQDGLEVLQDRL